MQDQTANESWILVVNRLGVDRAKEVVVAGTAFTLVTDGAWPPTFYVSALTTTGDWVPVYETPDEEQAKRVLAALTNAWSEGHKIFQIPDEV